MGRESNRHLCQSDKHLCPLSFSEKEIRNSMAKLSENENFGRLFAYGFRSASSLGSPKDDNRPRKGNGEPTADC